MLPYSPLAGGVLSGKYNDGKCPEGARFSRYLQQGQPRQKAMAERFVTDKTLETTERIIALAKKLDMDVVTLATAWSKQHDFVASTIVGASDEGQLDPIIAAADVKLDEETMDAILRIHRIIRGNIKVITDRIGRARLPLKQGRVIRRAARVTGRTCLL